jgi:hypothetical protein
VRPDEHAAIAAAFVDVDAADAQTLARCGVQRAQQYAQIGVEPGVAVGDHAFDESAPIHGIQEGAAGAQRLRLDDGLQRELLQQRLYGLQHQPSLVPQR